MGEGKEQVEAMENLNFLQQNDKGFKLIQNISFECTLTFKITWKYYETVQRNLWREYDLHKKANDKSCAKRF